MKGRPVEDKKKTVLASAVVALGWDCGIEEAGIDPDEWAKRFVSTPDDPTRFLKAFTSYLNEQLPHNTVVADLYADSDGMAKVKLRIELDGQELLRRLKTA